jgi:c-di-GMP-binding flagellar brake protein YcgR
MGMTTPFPEPESPQLEPYKVSGRVEILGMLRGLREAGAMITAYFDDSASGAVVLLLEVDEEHSRLVFDAPSDHATTERLLQAHCITFVAFHQQIKLQFRATGAARTTFDQQAAFLVALPGEVLRLQRRDSLRMRTPLTRPARCLVPHDSEARHFESLRVLDISVGGAAILSYPEKFELPVSQEIDGCFLDLPGIGSVNVRLRVRHVDTVSRDESARRCGCEFVDLAPQARMMLQRYVNTLEAEARKVAKAA